MGGYEYDDPVERCAWRLRERAYNDLLRSRLIRPVAVLPPAAGAEWSITVPPSLTWELLAVHYQLATSAVVANRVSTLQARDSAGVLVWKAYSGQSQPASQQVPYDYSQGLGITVVTQDLQSSLPNTPLPLASGFSLATSTGNIDAGDQYSQITVWVRELGVGLIYQTAAVLAIEIVAEVPTPLTADDAIPATLPGQPAPPAAAQ